MGRRCFLAAVKVVNYSLRGNERNQLNAMNEVGITDQIVIIIEAELLIIQKAILNSQKSVSTR